MSFVDSIADAVGLGGGDQPPAPPPQPATFKACDFLDVDTEAAKGSWAPGGVDNALESGELIEFIHFGHCHPDWHLNFDHASVKDTEWPDFTKSKYRAISFRAGALRETLLLDGFIQGTKEVLKEGPKGAGALGDALAFGASALGLGGPSGPKPAKPEDLDPYADRVSSAGGSVNTTSIHYLDVHKATVELHQVRSEYGAFVKDHVKPDTSPGLMPALPGIAGTVQKIATKAPDIYLAMFVAAREKAEPAIEDACYRITLDGIRGRVTPIFPLWSKFDKPAEAAPPAEGSDNLLQPINDAIQSAMGRINEVGQDVMSFLGLEGAEEAPGQPYLEAALDGFKDAGTSYTEAFRTMGVPLPGFLETLITEVSGANLELLRGALARVMLKPDEAISQDLLVRAGRHAITKRVLGLIEGLTGVDSLMNPSKPKDPNAGPDLGGMAAMAASNKLTGFLDDEVITKLDFLVEAAVSDVSDRIQEAQKAGGSPLTMEVLLGRTPWWLTHMTRNVVFPIWDLLVNKILGSVLGPLGGMVSSVESTIGDINSTADKVSGAADKIGKFAGENHQLGAGSLSDAKNFADDPMGALKKQFWDDDSPPPAPKFPGAARVPDGEGEPVTLDDINAADKKWESAERDV